MAIPGPLSSCHHPQPRFSGGQLGAQSRDRPWGGAGPVPRAGPQAGGTPRGCLRPDGCGRRRRSRVRPAPSWSSYETRGVGGRCAAPQASLSVEVPASLLRGRGACGGRRWASGLPGQEQAQCFVPRSCPQPLAAAGSRYLRSSYTSVEKQVLSDLCRQTSCWERRPASNPGLAARRL